MESIYSTYTKGNVKESKLTMPKRKAARKEKVLNGKTLYK